MPRSCNALFRLGGSYGVIPFKAQRYGLSQIGTAKKNLHECLILRLGKVVGQNTVMKKRRISILTVAFDVNGANIRIKRGIKVSCRKGETVVLGN